MLYNTLTLTFCWLGLIDISDIISSAVVFAEEDDANEQSIDKHDTTQTHQKPMP